jgi:hypothetical protein
MMGWFKSSLIRPAVWLFAWVLVTAMPTIAAANVIAPAALFLPGVYSLLPVYALPASVLAAVVERRFLERAGLESRSLPAALQANLVTTLLGFLLMPIGYVLVYSCFPLVTLAAVAVSCWVELKFLTWRTGQRLDRSWLIAGNLTSALVLFGVSLMATFVEERQKVWARQMNAIDDDLWAFVAIVATLISVFSFCWPLKICNGEINDERLDEPHSDAG